jgi:hypothetical protein
MQITNYKAFDWNRGVAPEGNLAGVHPQKVADLCDELGIPWWTSGWPYSSGLYAFCVSDEIWSKIIKMSK